MSTPSAKARAGGTAKRVRERCDEELSLRSEAVGLDVRVASVPDGGRAVGVAFACPEELREHQRREVVDDLDRAHGRDRDRRRPDAVHDGPLGRDQPDRPRDALVPRHVPRQQREDRCEEAAPGRPVGAVDPPTRYLDSSGEVVREGVASLIASARPSCSRRACRCTLARAIIKLQKRCRPAARTAGSAPQESRRRQP